MDPPNLIFHEQARVYYWWDKSRKAYYWWDQDALKYRIWEHKGAQVPYVATPKPSPSPSVTHPNSQQGQHPAMIFIHAPASVTINNYYGNQYQSQQPPSNPAPFASTQQRSYPAPPAGANNHDHKGFSPQAYHEPEPEAAPLYAERDPLQEIPQEDPDLPQEQEAPPATPAPAPTTVSAPTKPKPKPKPNHQSTSTKGRNRNASKKGERSDAGRRLYILREEKSFLGMYRRSRTLQVRS